MISLFFRNLIFTILQPGIVAGLVPFLIVRDKLFFPKLIDFKLHNYIGVFLFLIGSILMMYCIYDFAVKGKGTLSPADKTKKLVISGLYKYSRNPMYVGVLLVLLGEVIFIQSLALFIYSILVFLGFRIFVSFVEEPRLKRDFGKQYEHYQSEVKRWI